ncbi:hypothetical protein F4778DRAFT_89544 [Xylariomycetidae sp. FL2044]|nr:hypothetical protein F4778DRAFT_89544 [Xylariomycetidae sp. FL2044]
MSYQLRPLQPRTPGAEEQNFNAYTYHYHNQHQQLPLPQPQQPPPTVYGYQAPASGPSYPPQAKLWYQPAGTQPYLPEQQQQQPSHLSSPHSIRKSPFSSHNHLHRDHDSSPSSEVRTLGGATTRSARTARTAAVAVLPPRQVVDRRGRICGIQRVPFLVTLAVGLFLLVVAIAVGLGVGLSLDSRGGSSSSSTTSTTPTPTTGGSTTGSSTIKTSPTPSFTGTLAAAPVTCPADNGTVYVSAGTSKPFDVQCGRDYSSGGGARDISHMQAATMADCIDACGSQDGCVGVGWGDYEGTLTCWMKSQLGEPNWSEAWYFARLQGLS